MDEICPVSFGETCVFMCAKSQCTSLSEISNLHFSSVHPSFVFVCHSSVLCVASIDLWDSDFSVLVETCKFKLISSLFLPKACIVFCSVFGERRGKEDEDVKQLCCELCVLHGERFTSRGEKEEDEKRRREEDRMMMMCIIIIIITDLRSFLLQFCVNSLVFFVCCYLFYTVFLRLFVCGP